MEYDITKELTSWQIDPDERFMREAFKEALKAAEAEEVPVGAVIVHDGHIIARAYNQVEMLNDATAHAEMIAMTQASAALNNWRLTGATMYVTKEPCAMCAGAMVNARLERLVYGVPDKQFGGAVSLFPIVDNPSLRHRVQVTSGVMAQECKDLLRDFFLKVRQKD
ncbi:MAG: tRNA adenosine(34) deaminase TadA [Candidatus Auribacterota bacterium]